MYSRSEFLQRKVKCALTDSTPSSISPSADSTFQTPKPTFTRWRSVLDINNAESWSLMFDSLIVTIAAHGQGSTHEVIEVEIGPPLVVLRIDLGQG